MDDAELLRLHLANRDSPCPGCGYNLRSLPEGRCPECNEEIVLRASLAEPRLAAYLAALLPIAVVCGTMMLVVVIALGITAAIGKGPGAKERIVVYWFPIPAIAVLIWPMVRFMTPGGRRWFRRRTPEGRTRLIWLSFAIAATVMVAWSYVLVSRAF